MVLKLKGFHHSPAGPIGHPVEANESSPIGGKGRLIGWSQFKRVRAQGGKAAGSVGRNSAPGAHAGVRIVPPDDFKGSEWSCSPSRRQMAGICANPPPIQSSHN